MIWQGRGGGCPCRRGLFGAGGAGWPRLLLPGRDRGEGALAAPVKGTRAALLVRD